MFSEGTLLELNAPIQEESIIKVFGVGGGGSNAVNHMCRQGIRGVEFVICNTDIQALRISPVKNRIQIGKELTEGRGAGSLPERGRQSAEESLDYIKTILERNTKMIFITAGMGGGTGTGAAPIIARQAKELGILTIGIVTIPFNFEGKRRVEQAMAGVDELVEYVDALLIICNEKLRDMYGDLKLSKAFEMADNVLTIAAKSIAEIITLKGFVNVDFADVEVVMRNSGVALMGAGEAEGENRALDAVKMALESPLLNSNDIRGASNILLNMLYGDKEITMDEITLITDYLKELVGYDVNVIWGAGKDDSLGDELRVAVIATGFNGVPVDTKRSPISFKVEEIEDLELKVVDPKKLEEEERQRKQKQEENRLRRLQRERQRKEMEAIEKEEEKDFEEEVREKQHPARNRKRGINEVPDVDSWFKRKLGTMFSEDMSRDTEL
ncbi:MULTISPECIES: cell division protein FtsZ [Sanguibacteroides]|uniref:Cell division protein FtsZ n=1 Tax=Sanguibacteroides justesenii TaxID=1547597 RepID=A0A0C3RIU2_9PORP|nr:MULTISPECIES: cell division protein FtsZ [Sanguibacteroides]KIO43800.1 cell division protein FtsZ [Sanguibacteroides justesenii]KIO45964.1 cell division protein FtsZ [Sanguibacteroides justesenii]PXZ44955.1 cell division protein FtsZ [Sanguibacteroides justesenii]